MFIEYATTETHIVETLIIAALKLIRTVHICFDFDFLKLTLGLEAGDISPVLELKHFSFNFCLVLCWQKNLAWCVFDGILSFG